jgi:hypothetical protein
VSTLDIVPYRDSLDLLHRFVPTPLTAAVQLDCAKVLVQTNDLSFFPSRAKPENRAASHTDNQPPPSCLWKVVRDVSAGQELTEPSIVIADELLVCSMGPACIVAADRARREVLAFVGASVDARTYQHTVLPTLYRVTEFVMRSTSSSAGHADPPFAFGDQCNA